MEELTFEVVRPWQDYQIRYAMFDFDGTISLIRQGWQDIMIPYFMEVLRETGTQETDQEIHDCVQEFVDRLTGKQTIYQCIQLAEEITALGGTPEDPQVYKDEYQRRLHVHIDERAKGLREKVVIYSHAWRNALLPVITSILGWFLSIFSGSVVIENTFGLSGMGRLYWQGLNNNDFELVLAIQMFYSIVSLTGSLLIDISYGLVDPRVRVDK